jgi:hypothetical protein
MPGRKFSITTSLVAIRSLISASPRGLFMLTARLFLLRLNETTKPLAMPGR